MIIRKRGKILKRILFILIFALTLAVNGYAFNVNVDNLCFSPNGGCTDMIVNEINNAKKEVLVQAYSFTSAPIAQAVVNAHKRGVAVDVILDKSQESERYSSATFLKNAGVTTLIDHKHAIAHNKVIIIDQRIVITGSFNFTKAAEEKNAENAIVIESPQLTAKYRENYLMHREHSQ